MKKIVTYILMILVFPLAVSAISSYSYSDNNQTLVNTDNPTLNLSTNNLNINGPLSLTGQYSKLYGFSLIGKWTQRLSLYNAIALELSGGKNQHRINATWGHAFTEHQRIKLTAEYLQQYIDFDFLTGTVSKWAGQPAYGISYEYLLTKGILQSINFGATYSRAESQTLHPITDLEGNQLLRHIAGAMDKNVSLGIHLLPQHSTLVGLRLDYDNVKYNTRYEKGHDTSGLGGTITLDQILNHYFKLKLLASHRKPYQQYEATLNWLIKTTANNYLELGLTGTRIQGNRDINNDNRLALNLDYMWDSLSSNHKTEYRTFTYTTPISNLTNWTATPSVHMEQVLAIRDQKLISESSQSHAKKVAGTQHKPYPNLDNTPKDMTFSISKTITPIKLPSFYDTKLSPKGLFYDDQSQFNTLTLRITGIDDDTYHSGLTVKFEKDSKANDEGTVTISGTTSDVPHTYHITIYAKNLYGENDQTQSFNVIIEPAVPKINIPDQLYSYYEPVNVNITKYIDFGADKLTKAAASDLTQYGLKLNLSANGKKVTITGTPTKRIQKTSIPIAVTNDGNKTSPKGAHFNLTIAATTPIVTIPDQHYIYHDTVNVNITKHIFFGSDALSSVVASTLNAYGLKTNLSADGKTVTITGTPSQITDKISVPITVKNDFNVASKDAKFNLIIVPGIPSATIPDQHYFFNKPVNVDITQFINFAGAHTLTKVEAPDLTQYGLKINLSKDGKKVTITGTPNQTFDNKVIPVSITNDGNKTSQNVSFNLKVTASTPTIQIPDQAYTFNQTVNKDISEYLSFGSLKLSKVDAPKLKDYGLQLNLNADGKTVTITGDPNQLIADAPIPVTITNDSDQASKTTNFNLTILPDTPIVNIPDQHYIFNTLVNIDITKYITFGSLALSKAESTDLNQYGLKINLSSDGKTVTITGKPNQVISNITIPLTVKNDGGKEANNPSFNLTINAKAPAITIPDQTFNHAENVFKDLTSYFDFGSDTLTKVEAPNLKQYNLSLQLGDDGHRVILTGAPSKVISDQIISVSVINSSGLDAKGDFKLSVLSHAPQMSIPDQTVHFDKEVDTELTKYIFIGADKITKIQTQKLSDYGLNIELDKTGQRAFLKGTPTKITTIPDDIPVVITNSDGKSTDTSFKLTVKANKPVITIPDQTYRLHQGVKLKVTDYIDFGAHKLKSVESTDLEKHGLKFKLSDDGKTVTIEGSKVLRATENPETMHVYVTNEGDIKGEGTFELTVTPLTATLKCPTAFDHVSNGIASATGQDDYGHTYEFTSNTIQGLTDEFQIDYLYEAQYRSKEWATYPKTLQCFIYLKKNGQHVPNYISITATNVPSISAKNIKFKETRSSAKEVCKPSETGKNDCLLQYDIMD